MADTHTPLANCPFCGGENLEFYYADIEGWIAHVRCIECDDMIGPMSEWKHDDKFEAAEDASTKWNRRAPSQDAETVRALKEQIATKDAALRKAEQFIVNGTEYGFIRLPFAPDSALETLPQIRAALAGSTS